MTISDDSTFPPAADRLQGLQGSPGSQSQPLSEIGRFPYTVTTGGPTKITASANGCTSFPEPS